MDGKLSGKFWEKITQKVIIVKSLVRLKFKNSNHLKNESKYFKIFCGKSILEIVNTKIIFIIIHAMQKMILWNYFKPFSTIIVRKRLLILIWLHYCTLWNDHEKYDTLLLWRSSYLLVGRFFAALHTLVVFSMETLPML